MGVRSLLALGVGAGPLVLDKGGSFLEAPVRLDRHNGRTAAAIVRYQGVVAGLIDADAAGAGPAGCDFVDEREGPRSGVDRERAHGARLTALKIVDLADRV